MQTFLHPPPFAEDAIRTLGVSLIAIAAVAASLSLARQIGVHRASNLPRLRTDDLKAPVAVHKRLEAIRRAGL